MKQKFKAFSFVHVCREPVNNRHYFDKEFDAIVEGTYSQLYGGGDVKSYSLYIIKDSKVVNGCAWFSEKLLTQINEKYAHMDAHEMIEEYNLKLENDD